MLRSIKEMVGYKVGAIDEVIGSVDDFYFDDHSWNVRYVVVDTGKWLTGRRVLVSPTKVGTPDWPNHVIPVKLKTDEIKDSPGIGVDLPVSIQKEIDLQQYAVWAPYWPPVGSAIGSIPPVPPGAVFPARIPEEERGDPRLRSAREVINYRIETTEGGLGHVEDFIAHTESWMLFYLVIDTRNWLPGRKVLVAVDWVAGIDWEKRQAEVDLTRDQVKNSPPYDPSTPVNREYEARLYDFYGIPRYWER